MNKAILAVVIVVLVHSRASGVLILDDDFESYADTAALAAVWNTQASPAGSLVLTGNPNKAIEHPGGNVFARTIAATSPSDAVPIVWEFDFFDDALNPGTGKRITGGLRNSGATVVLEMGRFNSIANPPGANVSGYGFRVNGAGESQTSGGPDNVDWITFSPNLSLQQGWHHMKATIGGSSILFEFDRGDDGSVDASRTIFTSTGAAEIYNNVRFGGPSNNSSAAGAILRFDNLRIETVPVVVPEVGSFAAVGLAGVLSFGATCLRRRRMGPETVDA